MGPILPEPAGHMNSRSSGDMPISPRQARFREKTANRVQPEVSALLPDAQGPAAHADRPERLKSDQSGRFWPIGRRYRALAIRDSAGYVRRTASGENDLSQTDSFIEEVTEAVRRDRLFRLARKYGWILALAIILVVGGAAFVEWQKSRQTAAAQALGDRILASLKIENGEARATALADIGDSGAAGALADMLAAAEFANSDPKRAGEILEKAAALPDLPQVYRDAAILKATMIRNYLMSDDKIARLEPLATPGAPLRLLALEQIALVQVEQGKKDAALATLQSIIEDADASPAERQRAQQTVLVLGGDPEGA
jgi:hypothetical protein